MSLRFLTAGESHGPALTAILEGLPAGLPMIPELIAVDLGRRQHGAGSGGRMAMEQDQAQILGGVMEGRTTGAPVSLLITNKDHANWQGRSIPPFTIPRPGHADLPAAVKYGYDDLRLALERASARETAARVAVGALCRAYLKTFGIEIGGWVVAIGNVTADTKRLLLEKCVETARASDVSCPDQEAAARMRAAINHAAEQGETLGGVVEVVATGVPVGLGSHVHWDRKLTSRLAAALMGIPATKGVEIGEAFANTALSGSQVQDPRPGFAVRGADRRRAQFWQGCDGFDLETVKLLAGLQVGLGLCSRDRWSRAAVTARGYRMSLFQKPSPKNRFRAAKSMTRRRETSL